MTLKAKLKTGYFETLLMKSGLSANQFSKNAGLSSGYMTQLMRHNQKPSPQTRKKIMNCLNRIASIQPVEFDDLFEIEDG